MRYLNNFTLVAFLAAASQEAVQGRLAPGLKKSPKIPTDGTGLRAIRVVRQQDRSLEPQTRRGDDSRVNEKKSVGRRAQAELNTTLDTGDEGIVGGTVAQSGGT